MAELKVQNVPTYVLRLSEEEAQALKAILGEMVGKGTLRDCSDAIYDALDAKCIPNGEGETFKEDTPYWLNSAWTPEY